MHQALRERKPTLLGGLKAQAAAIVGEDTTFLLLSFDLMNLSRFASRRLRGDVAKALNVQPHHIVTTVTQTHCGPSGDALSVEALTHVALTAASDALGTAEPVQLTYAEADAAHDLSVYRRQSLHSELGEFTAWGGFTAVVFSEANGEIGYIPTPAVWAGGDYEKYCSPLDPAAEPLLRTAASELIAAA
jgi:hypothetical protein